MLTILKNMTLRHWLTVLLVPPAVAFLAAWSRDGLAFSRAEFATDGKIALAALVAVLIPLLQRSPQDAAKIASGAMKMLGFAAVLGLGVSLSACMQAIPQPGQTPAQVQACSTDATLVNAMHIVSGVMAAGVTAEGSLATADQSLQKGAAIAVIPTGLVGGAAVIVAQVAAGAYNSDGCAPSLVGKPAQARVVVAPIAGADGRDYRFVELGWKPVTQ